MLKGDIDMLASGAKPFLSPIMDKKIYFLVEKHKPKALHIVYKAFLKPTNGFQFLVGGPP